MVRARRRTATRRTALCVSALAAAFVALCCGTAAAQSPLPEADGVLANGTDTAISPSRVNGDFQDLLGEPYGLDGLVLVVDNCAPDPEVYLDDALVKYGLADGPGRMYDDALAWLVCYEPRFVGFFWAANNPHAAALDADAVQNAMAERLQEDNFTGAFTAGIEETARQIAAGPPANTVGEGAGASGLTGDADSSAPGSGTVTESEDGGGVSSVGVLLLAAAVLVAAVWLWRRRRKRGGAAAAQRPDVPDDWRKLDLRVANLERTLTATNASVAHVILAYEPLGDEAVLGVHRRHQANVDRLQAMRARLESAAQTQGATDEADRAAQLESLSAETGALEAYVKEIEGEAAHAEMLVEKAGVLAVEARDALAEAATALGTVRSSFPDAGFPEPPALLAVATAAADAAETWLSGGNRLAGGRCAEESAGIARRLGQIAAGWEALDERVASSADTYRHLDGYARSSWADVVGNGHEAEESLETVPAMLSRLAGEGEDGRGLGKDSTAGFLASLEPVEGELTRGNTLLDAVDDRLKRIEADRDQARGKLDDAREAAAAARAHLAAPEIDKAVGSGPTDSLDGADKLLSEADAGLAVELPDWPATVRKIEDASKLVAQALAAANLEVERMEVVRKTAEDAATAADSAIARADSFLASHARDLGSAHVPKLQRARAAEESATARLNVAREIADAAAIRAYEEARAGLEEAARLANEAYEAMAADFSRIEGRRKNYVPRGDWMGPAVPVPVDVRPVPFPATQRGWRDSSTPRRPSSWGSRPSGGSGGGTGGSSSGSGSRPSSSRRGGGRAW